MEGLTVNPNQKLIYILRERNGNNQTEIYTLEIGNNDSLNYKNKFIINHNNNNWRYSDLYYDQDENVLFGLRSFYNRNEPEAAKCYVDEIPVDNNGFPVQPIIFHNDERNRCAGCEG